MPRADGSEAKLQFALDSTKRIPYDGNKVPNRILEVATGLFARTGYHGTSVQQIVDECGITKGALYHYFSSKDDILYELYARLLKLQMERLVVVTDSDAPIVDRVHASAVDVVETTVLSLEASMVFSSSFHLLDPVYRNVVTAERRRYHSRFRELILEGYEAGVFALVVPVNQVVNVFFGAVHYLARWYRPDGELTGTEVGEHFAALLLLMLGAPLKSGDRVVPALQKAPL